MKKKTFCLVFLAYLSCLNIAYADISHEECKEEFDQVVPEDATEIDTSKLQNLMNKCSRFSEGWNYLGHGLLKEKKLNESLHAY